MKNSKLRRVLLLLASAVLLVSLSVGATLAYLTSKDEVVNTFTVGTVKITLDEAVVDSITGEMITPDERTQANEYHLMPRHNYWKDPTVHITANSEDCYVFVKVENGIAAIEAPTSEFTKDIATQMAENGWVPLEGVENVFYYSQDGSTAWTQNAGEDRVVFTNFTINPEVLNGLEEGQVRDEDALYIADYVNAQVVVTAYAIQADGFTTPKQAWDAAKFE